MSTRQATRFIPRDEAVPVVIRNQFGEERTVWEYYRDKPGPQGFLVLMPENNTVNPHFHRLNQFQVFFPAEGARYQKTPLDRVEVHYTDGFKPYGPFTTGNAAMEFFTLRPAHDPSGGWIAYMPRGRARLTHRGKRNTHRTVADAADRSVASTVETLFEDPDGLCARVVHAPAGGGIAPLDPATGGGQYLVVLEGAARIDAQSYGVKSLLWLSQSDPVPAIEAGETGLTLLTVQFPVGSHLLPDGETAAADPAGDPIPEFASSVSAS